MTRAVERWFLAAGRDLPWRRERSGYAALVSEAMLQQTQVRRVVPAYVRFMSRFPTVGALAAAEEQEVLAHWQGLGYYGRARRLHAAAKVIVARHDGEVPSDAETLRGLPGVGRYTSGAIASIAFGRRAPIVDTNVARVLMRLEGVRGRPLDRETEAWAWERSESLVAAAGEPGRFNEGLMELGALVCTAAAPRCDACPLAKGCAARASGAPQSIHEPPAPARRIRVHHHAVLVMRAGRVLLEQRPPRGLWASMWQIPTIESAGPLAPSEVAARFDIPLEALEPRERIEHRTSHRDVVFLVHTARTRLRRDPAPRRWVPQGELAAYPLSNPMRTIVGVGA